MARVPRPVPPSLADLIAERFRVLGDASRIRILDQLRSGAATVGELAEVLDMSQQNVSKHLGILHRAGIVARMKEGTKVRYSILDSGVFHLCEQVCGGLERQLAEVQAVLGR